MKRRTWGLGLGAGVLALAALYPTTGGLMRVLLQAIVAAALWQPRPPVPTSVHRVPHPDLLLVIAWSLTALLAVLLTGGVAGSMLRHACFWCDRGLKRVVEAVLLLWFLLGAGWWGAGAARLIGGSPWTGALSGIALLLPLGVGMLAFALYWGRRDEGAAIRLLTGLTAISLPTSFGLSLVCAALLAAASP